MIRPLSWTIFRLAACAALAWLAGTSPGQAEYGRVPYSEVDSGLFRVNESRFLGARPDRATPLRDETGAPTTLGAYQGKPLIMVLAYYNCDGTCNVVNAELANRLDTLTNWTIGKDFDVLTVSFDANETPETLTKFRQALDLPPRLAQGWRFALPSGPEQARALADSVGFKYFWSAQDRAFLHPGIYVVLTPEGRIARFLYATNADTRDLELAITEAMGERISPAQFINLAVSLCYSYNFKDGRYKLNLPMFFGMASLVVGVVLFLLAAAWYRRRRAIFHPPREGLRHGT